MKCFCGGMVGELKDGVWTIRSHAPDCLWLAWASTLAAEDVCARCGHKFKVYKRPYEKLQVCVRCKLSNYQFGVGDAI